MKQYFKLLTILILSIFLFSCESSDDPDLTPVQEEFPDLQIFVDRFVEEAQLRGYTLDLSNVDAEYTDELTRNDITFCGIGYVNFQQTGRRTVLISKAEYCAWATKSDLERENLFFHELGHAVLNLPHDNALKCDGKPLSMMTEQFNTFEIYKEGEEELRTYYLDELFDRLVANEQCIDFGQDFGQDPVFFANDMSDPSWNFSNDNGNYQVSRGVHENSETTYLGISSEGNGQNTGYIYKQLDAPNIPEGASVTLRTKVNAENLQGPGVAIALRVYEREIGTTGATTTESHLLSTEPNPVSGDLNDYVMELTLPNFTRKTIFMIPFAVMMPGTEGQAYFDDFEIIVEDMP
ncbi:hypothetical protein [Mongoliibacter ruber]|uniref:Dual-action HEIGH metallo-peptidase n=1 Tax=Mongoliibacter ruber TaxID=1750599 RepID=A0A2T0WFG5_9BACT|nr:hypothetical protein [Mongoliibacter ruber]PRY85450.1 hypothetical protein CLW00_11231 [Mongoliibacter ruber]